MVGAREVVPGGARSGYSGLRRGRNQILFYLARMSLLDPILVAISLAALPALAQALRRREPAATLLARGWRWEVRRRWFGNPATWRICCR